MNITRHNYEAFFLLYVDKELSAAERKAVEVFAKQNPDLQIELVLLQQTVLKADDIVLDKKDWLYIEEAPTALQEHLLLYADDELSISDKQNLQALLARDKAAKAEWNILQQTKLEPDTSIVFDDKASLYRRKAGRVIAIKWWRVAAAAVLLGFGIWTGVSVYNNSLKTVSGTAETANNDNINSTQTTTDETVNNTTTVADALDKSTAENVLTTTPTESKTLKNKTTLKAVEQNKNRTIDPTLQNINSTSSNKNIIADVQPSNSDIGRVSGNKINVVENKTTNTNNNNKADQPVAIVQVSNTETEDNSRYLNIDDKQKRTTLGGLIRKAKRVVERTTNINTGEGIKIAGFEIALK